MDHLLLREFVAAVQEIRDRTTHDRRETLSQLEPYFLDLLVQSGWLPAEFAEPNPTSAMGGGIGQWLLYRSQDRSLTVFSLRSGYSNAPCKDEETVELS